MDNEIDSLDWGPDEVQDLISQADRAVADRRLQDAVPLYERAVAALDTPRGMYDPDLANSLHKLGDAYCALDRFEDACPVFSRLLNIGEHVLGPSDPDVIVIAMRLATTYDLIERQEEAGTAYARVVQMAEQGLASSDPLTQKVRDAYAEWLERQARPRRRTSAEIAQLEEEAQARKVPPRPTVDLDEFSEEAIAAPVRQAPVNVWYRLLRKVNHLQQIVIPIICSSLLLVGAFFWMQSLVRDSGDKITAQPVQVSEGQEYKALDGNAAIKFLDGGTVELKIGESTAQIPYVVLSNSVAGARKALEGYFISREYWLAESQDGLEGEDGGRFYSQFSPEFSVVDQMNTLAEYCQKYYREKNTYPANAERWQNAPISRWTNPTTGRADLVPLQALSLDLGYPFLFRGAQNDAEIKNMLSRGGHWADEPEPGPCSIRCLSVFGTEKSVDGFKADEFYIHGYDRNAKVLSHGLSGDSYYILLKNGEKTSANEFEKLSRDKNAAARLIPTRIVIVRNAGDNPFVLKYLGPAIVGGTGIFFTLLWMIVDLPSRMRKEKKGPRLLELLTFVFLAIYAAWHAVRFMS